MNTGHTEKQSKMTKGLRYRESMSITGAWVGVVMAVRGCGTLRCIFLNKPSLGGICWLLICLRMV